MNTDISADPEFKPAALDAIDVVYAVTAKFVVTAGAYNGIPDKEAIVALINSGPSLSADNIDTISIIEVRLDDDVIAQAEGAIRSEEHTSELQSLMRISYAVFCLKKKKQKKQMKNKKDHRTKN